MCSHGRARRRIGRWPLLAAVGVLLVYGAPVMLSGQATFTGFIKLDDTATWFNIVDNVMSPTRARSSGEPPSTFTLVYTGDVGPTYPLGAFMLPGVARALTGIDIAWVFQPYLACCGAAVALCLYALMEPLVASPGCGRCWRSSAAQSALLYGYSLWGGIKELTAAFLLALGVALAAAILAAAPAALARAAPARGRGRSADPDARGRRGGLGGAGARARGRGLAVARGRPRRRRGRASARSRGWPG